MNFTVVVLTYNRRHRIEQQIQHLQAITLPGIEIIVVDNGSEEEIDDLVVQDSRIRLIRNTSNLGAVGRNVGIRAATGRFIVTLDDDVYGLTDSDLNFISKIFVSKSSIAAINFLVLDEITESITDWCHPRDMHKYSKTTFLTNDISEGAVAFRKSALKQVGVYPDSFFISHEGPDLAFRLINSGFDVIFSPDISVFHTYEQKGRDSWRRYYYDTRNQLWLAIRNYPFIYAFKQLSLAWGSVFIYAVRDGFVAYWFKGIVDGVMGSREAYRERQSPTIVTMKKIKAIEALRPGVVTRIKKRVFSNVLRG